GNIRKVDNRTIAKSSDLKETAKGRYIPGNPLGDNLLLQIRARIGLKIRPGVVRKINRGDQSPFDNAKQIKLPPELLASEGVQILRASPAAKQVDAAAPEL